MIRINQWLRDYLTPPPHLDRPDKRSYAIASAAFPMGVVIHMVFVALFVWLDQPAMALFNVASVVIWLVALVQARSGRFILTFTLIAIEMILHSGLAVQTLGTAFGFQYYLFTLLPSVFVARMPRFTQWGLVAVSMLMFIILSFGPELVWAGNPLIAVALNIFNIIGAAGVIALIGSYSYTVTRRAEDALADAHAKSEGLLHNILPDEIVERLKQNSETIADGFTETSVLFADIADFTPLSQRMTPAEVVQMLDDLFSRFDVLVRKHKLEKIKTIGDAYMVAAGVPTPRADHAEVMVAFAQDMQQAIRDYNAEKGTAIRLRIGINSGPVVAGVIGKMRFLYDLWGDSVNTASRMESHGVPDEIQISEDTRALLDGKYRFEDRGMIEIKGKGMMRTYFLREALAQPIMETA
jgi:adenylate cyclase